MVGGTVLRTGLIFLYYYLAHGGEILNQNGILAFDQQVVLKVLLFCRP